MESFPIYVALPAVVAIVIACLLIRTLWDVRKALRSRGWTETRGVITASEGRELHGALIRYRYTAEGRELDGHRVCFGDSAKSSWRALVLELAEYRRGATVPVYYDPANPAEAVLQTGVSRLLMITVAFRGVFLAGALLALFLALKG